MKEKTTSFRGLPKEKNMFNLKVIKINKILQKALDENDLDKKIKMIRNIPEAKEPSFGKKTAVKLSPEELNQLIGTVENRLKESSEGLQYQENDEYLLKDIAKIINNEKNRIHALLMIRKINFSKINLVQKDFAILAGALFALAQALKEVGLSFKNLNKDQRDVLANGRIDIYDMKVNLKRTNMGSYFGLAD